MPEDIQPKKYHVVGVAGVGMSAIAQLLLSHGYEVSGSDRFHDKDHDLEVFHKLENGGLTLTHQDGSGITRDLEGVVVSTAIEKDNPDVARARELDVPVIHRAEMLACLTAGNQTIAVTGTSGKTTVTGMIGWILECVGLDPTVINGGALVDWKTAYRIGNVRVGRSKIWVVEADESDRSLLNFQPDWAVITNISRDHFGLDEIIDLFRQFSRRVKKGIICGPGIADLISGEEGIGADSNVELVSEIFVPEHEGAFFGFWYKGLTFQSNLIGKHNAENAFAAVVLCERLGIDLVAIRNALTSFGGIERRLQRSGGTHGVIVVDDYAHNPAKIRAAWESLTSMHARILGVWRPHGFAPLKMMMDELADTFKDICRESDRVFILPVFYAGGTTTKDVTSEDFVALLRERNVDAQVVEDYDALIQLFVSECHAGDCVLSMGARDPYLPVFSRRLVAALESV